MAQRTRWTFGVLPDGEAEAHRHLNERLQDLDVHLASYHEDLTFGPVDGAYFVVPLTATESAGTALPTGVLDRYAFEHQMTLAHLSLFALGGDITVDVHSQGSTILAAPVSLVAGTEQTFGDPQDFAVSDVTGDLTLEADSIDIPTPHKVTAILTCFRVTKIGGI